VNPADPQRPPRLRAWTLVVVLYLVAAAFTGMGAALWRRNRDDPTALPGSGQPWPVWFMLFVIGAFVLVVLAFDVTLTRRLLAGRDGSVHEDRVAPRSAGSRRGLHLGLPDLPVDGFVYASATRPYPLDPREQLALAAVVEEFNRGVDLPAAELRLIDTGRPDEVLYATGHVDSDAGAGPADLYAALTALRRTLPTATWWVTLDGDPIDWDPDAGFG
jgi:hypothetical protein